MPATRKQEALDAWMSIGDAAKALGESKFLVLSRIARGELVSQHIAKRTIVRRDSVEALLAARAA